MESPNIQVGRVLRVGRGWVDVTIDRKVRRVRTRPDLLVRAGNYLQITHDQGIALLPSQRSSSNRLQ